jgi:autotransporter-associated beta strand protein
LTVSGTGLVNCTNLDVSRNANGNARGSAGVVNLNGGTITTARVGTATANSQPGPATSGVNPTASFNFNGGTLKATASATNFFQGSTAAPAIPLTTTVKSGGAIVDDGGFAITVLEPLQHDSSLGVTPDGGLIKQGVGTMTMTAASTYTGNTVVSNGTLVVNGSLAAASTVTVTANGTLSGIGTVGGTVTVNGTITPGTATTNGLLTCSAGVTLNGTSLMKLNNLTNDALVVGGNLAYGGTLNVSILAGTPALNNSFKLFTAASYSSNFAIPNLPALTAGLAWNWNPANGTLSVVSGVNPNPTSITATVSGSTLTLAWPADHTGWTLQSQTNTLGTGLNPNPAAWVNVPGSTSVNSVTITLDPTQPAVFYRMKL